MSVLWSTIGLSILQSYRKLDVVNVEATLYDVFQSAKHIKNMRAWHPFKDQREYCQLMAAAAKLCHVCMCRERKGTLSDIYVERDLVETLCLERPCIAGFIQFAYTPAQIIFIKGALVQLSQLDLDEHVDHIKRIGGAMRNCPSLFFGGNWNVDDWTMPLRVDNVFSDDLAVAIEELYGIDWCWVRLPSESEKGPVVLTSSASSCPSWHALRYQK